MIVSDSYFTIGDLHIRSGKPCQDYSIARVMEDRAIAIVSDGCSSGGLVDVGARILAHAMLSSYIEHQAVNIVVDTLRKMMRLEWEDMLATLVYVYIEPSCSRLVFFGDGSAVINYVDHTELILVKYESGAPYYYSYKLSNNYDDYLTMQCQKKISVMTCIDSNLTMKEITPEEASSGIFIELEDNLVSVTIFSDGISSFTNVDWMEACEELTYFKNMTGEYLKRRMARAIQDYNKQGIKMMDDIAGASLYNMR